MAYVWATKYAVEHLGKGSVILNVSGVSISVAGTYSGSAGFARSGLSVPWRAFSDVGLRGFAMEQGQGFK